MRAFCIVLLVAASAVAAPSYQVMQQDGINNMILPNKGADSNAFATTFTLLDAGETEPYVLTLKDILIDLISLKDSHAQSVAVMQYIAVMGTQLTGYAGNSCAAASAIADYAAGGTAASYRPVMAQYVDYMVEAHKKPYSLHYVSGPSGNCVGGGTVYPMEAAWDRIFGSTSSYSTPLVNEAYCTVKSLYNANHIRSNNAGAAATAGAAVGEEGCDYHKCLNLVYALAYNQDVEGAAAACKRALMS